jgi:HEAT repeat protein
MAATSLRIISGQTPSTVPDWFQTLVRGPAHSARPSLEELSAVSKRVTAASSDEIRGALPWMIAAITSGDEAKRNYAYFALVAVGVRPDAPALLSGHEGDLEALLMSPDPLLERGAVVVLGSLQDRRPVPLPGLRETLEAFVKRTDRDLEAQVSALAFLLSKWEAESSTQNVVAGFWSRDLDVNSRDRVLTAVGRGNANPKPARLTALIASALEDPHAPVRGVAIEMLSLIGPEAVMGAEPLLRKLAQDTSQPDSVRSAARKALRDAGLPVE